MSDPLYKGMSSVFGTMGGQLQVHDDVQKVAQAANTSGDAGTLRSLPIMTKYEFDQVIGLRTMHLSKGAPPLVEVPSDFRITTNMHLREIALREMQEHRLPYIIKRPLPNGKTEYVRVGDLDLTAVQHLMRRR